MSEICITCGLPQDLCVCASIATESQKIEIFIDRKRYGKKYTVIQGIDEKQINLKDLTKQLKEKLACGGTTKKGLIELQGDHKQAVKQVLLKLGFAPETIELQ